jgi:hypothetical protein
MNNKETEKVSVEAVKTESNEAMSLQQVQGSINEVVNGSTVVLSNSDKTSTVVVTVGENGQTGKGSDSSISQDDSASSEKTNNVSIVRTNGAQLSTTMVKIPSASAREQEATGSIIIDQQDSLNQSSHNEIIASMSDYLTGKGRRVEQSDVDQKALDSV